MKDLKSFKNTAQSPEETLNKYKDLTDDELIGLLISQVKKQRKTANSTPNRRNVSWRLFRPG